MSSPGQSSQRKRNLGRRKVKIEKIKNVANLHVTFSKRRVGLFKKASELCTLTSAEAGLVVFSPGNKAHSFGHPNIETIADRFLTSNPSHANVVRSNHVEQSSTPSENRDMKYLALLEKQLEAEKAKKKELSQSQMGVAIEKLNFQQLEVLRGKVKNLESRMVSYNVAHQPSDAMAQYGMAHGAVIPYDHRASEADAPWLTLH